jgi:hypothetical protein
MYLAPFSSSDARMANALEKAEPRIHFALNCGAKSCPPIKTYSAENVRKQAIMCIVVPESPLSPLEEEGPPIF